MQFVNIRELSRSLSKYIKIANEADEVVITKNGHPYALLSKIDDVELEDLILAKHFRMESEFEVAKQDYQSGKTVNVKELLKDVNKALENEI
ncbi:MAG: type II toxin-antitoxin system prevent-host-death family antitoxin [bacterium]|nr:type II toxin-antitoxin system prevent-host-death family antitoxin [bacterium]